MIYVKMISTLLCCFLLALFYHDSSTFIKLDDGSLNSWTSDINYNILHTEPSPHMNQSKTTKILAGENGSSYTRCGDEIHVDEGSAAYNKENVNCVQDFINTCSKIDVYLLYSTGSMSLRITGLINGSCQIDIVHELERDSNSYTCMIPISRLSTWESWRSSDGLDVIGDVLDLCSRK